MNYWEPDWPATLLTIALFLMGAIGLGVLAGWAPEDDTNETNTNATGNEPQAEKGNQR